MANFMLHVLTQAHTHKRAHKTNTPPLCVSIYISSGKYANRDNCKSTPDALTEFQTQSDYTYLFCTGNEK